MSSGTYPSTGTYSSRGSMGWFRLVVTATNKTNGTTDIKCELQHRRGSKLTFSNTASGSVGVTVAGTTKYLSLPNDLALNTATGTWATVYTQTLNFTRTQSNQSATITVSNLAYYSYNTSSTWSAVWDTLNAGTYTYTLSLDTIQLNSTFSSYSSVVYTLEKFSATVARNGTSFWHKIQFKSGSTVLATTDAFETWVEVTVPRSWLSNFTSQSILSVDAVLTTYSSSACTSTIGVTVTASFSVIADGDMKPVIGDNGVTITNINEYAASGITGFLQGYSSAKATFNTSGIDLSATAGASIASYKIEVEGSTYTGNPATSAIITGSGTVSIKATVTDTRGRSGSTTINITVYSYSGPTISVSETYRCDSSGNADDDKRYVAVKVKSTFASIGEQNSVTIRVTINNVTTVVGNNVRTILGDDSIDPDTTYTVFYEITDTIGNKITYYVKLATRVWAMQFCDNAKGVAFGKAAEHENALQVPEGWKLMIGDVSLVDLIHPVGSYYWSSSPKNPKDLFGGTWEQIKDRFVYAVGDDDDVGTTGGSDSVTLTKENIPNYELGKIATVVPPEHGKWSNGGISDSNLGTISSTKKGVYCPASNSITVTSGTQWSWTIGSNGGDEAHDNMPPYIKAYCWHRTA